MADLTINTTIVSLTNGVSSVEQVTYGESVSQGMVLYEDTSDSNKYKKAVNNTATLAAAKAIALTPGASGEKGYVVKSGEIDLGATLAVGMRYFVSNTAGAICPSADIGTGEYVTLIGIATAAGVLKVNFQASGIASA